MRFSAILVTLGLTGALATPTLVSRQTAPAVGVISDIQAQTSALASAVSAFNGGDATPVETASKKLIDTINTGVQTVSSGPDLTTTDALALTSPVQDLTKQVQGVVSDLISKKDQFVSAGAGPTVYQSLQAQYTAADNLSKAISAKVPSALSDIAAQLSAGITAAIQKGIDAYKDVATATSSATSTASSTATETSTMTETSTGTSTATATETATTSTAVIPSGTGSASTTPSGSATPSKTSSGSTSTSTNLLATGAASKEHFSYSLGGAVVAAAIAVAF
ncbi:Cell wall mannoprotein 1 [Aspergillus turcosus]|nr:Cell wall mannoprotein 1 [Aspergillus turcosus]